MPVTEKWLPQKYYDVYKNHTGKVSHKWTHYFYVYDRLFTEFLDKGAPVTLLEIGVQNGGSLEIWKKYFPPDSQIHGLDINEKCSELKFGENIYFHLGSAADLEFINANFQDKTFDIIIDDGSHICNDVINAFRYLFPKLKDGGLYVVEDMQNSYWNECGGGLRAKHSSVEYFKTIIDELNYDWVRPIQSNKLFNMVYYRLFNKTLQEAVKKWYDRSVKSGNVYKDSESDIHETVSEVRFFDSVCAVKKYYGRKTKPFTHIITGKDADIQKVNSDAVTKNKTENVLESEMLFTKV
jgi:cephalosporin hydroxylase